MATTKKKKGKYVKKNHEFWAKRSRKKPDAEPPAAQIAIAPKPNEDNKELLDLILAGVKRLSIGDKARVLAHTLGRKGLDENQLWAIQKILA